MGTFQGHFFNGLSFVILSTWWTINVWRCHFRSRCPGAQPFQPRFAYPGPFTRKLPLESIFKIVATTLCILFELLAAFDDKGRFVQWGNAQHMTMAFFFGLTGVIDLLLCYRPKWLPNGLDVAVGTLSFTVEGFTFGNHKHGKPPAELQAHAFLLYAIAAILMCIYLEACCDFGSISSLSRAFFTLLQGTWLIQIGFMFFPPFGWFKPWAGEDHRQMALATVSFGCHCAVDLLVIGGIGWIVHAVMQRRGMLEGGDCVDEDEKKCLRVSLDAVDDELE